MKESREQIIKELKKLYVGINVDVVFNIAEEWARREQDRKWEKRKEWFREEMYKLWKKGKLSLLDYQRLGLKLDEAFREFSEKQKKKLEVVVDERRF